MVLLIRIVVPTRRSLQRDFYGGFDDHIPAPKARPEKTAFGRSFLISRLLLLIHVIDRLAESIINSQHHVMMCRSGSDARGDQCVEERVAVVFDGDYLHVDPYFLGNEIVACTLFSVRAILVTNSVRLTFPKSSGEIRVGKRVQRKCS